jgi:hypothetical protein
VLLYQKIGVRNQALQSTPDQQNYQEQKKKREGKSKGYLRETRVFGGEIIMYIKKGKESYEPEKYCSSL